MNSAIVSSVMVPMLLAKIREAGGDARTIGRALGVSDRTKAGVPEASLRALAEHAATVAGDPFLGLHLGAAHQRGLHGALEMACSAAPTLGALCERLVQYATLIQPELSLALLRDGELVRLERPVPVRHVRHEGRHLQEFILATMVQIGRAATGGRLRIERVWLTRKRTRDIEPLVRFFGTRDIVLDADRVGFAFPTAMLALPCATSDPAMVPVLDEYAHVLLSKVPRRGPDPLARFRDTIRDHVGEGDVTMRRVAGRLAMSPRTLQRLLAAAGTSFRQVLDDVRSKLASHYLDDLGLPPDEVAARLGYSDSRAFFRAYKRWTGATPRQQRARTGVA